MTELRPQISTGYGALPHGSAQLHEQMRITRSVLRA